MRLSCASHTHEPASAAHTRRAAPLRAPGLSARAGRSRRVRRPCAASDSRRPHFSSSSAPSWLDGRVGLYYTKRKGHQTDELGNIPAESYEDCVEPAGWTADAQLRLAAMAVADEVGCEAEEVAERCAVLLDLAPALRPAVGVMKAADLARLAMSAGDVASQLVALRTLFPTADLDEMVSKQPQILLADCEKLRVAREELLGLLPTLNIDKVVSKQPLLLQLRNAAGFVEDAKRLMPGQDVAKVLEKRPGLVLELQSFDDIIPYDNGSAKQLERTLALRASGEKGGDGVGSPDGW